MNATPSPRVPAPASGRPRAVDRTPRRLAHVNLWVKDIERAERFYRDVCGLMIEFTEPELLATFMGVGHTQHDLGMMKTTDGVDRLGRDGRVQIPGTIGRESGLNHIAWELESEKALLDTYACMKRLGVPSDAAMDHQIAHSIYLFDPDGNYNEVYCDTTRDWRGVLSGEMSLITSRWDPEQAAGSQEQLYPTGTTPRRHETAVLKPSRLTHLVLETPQLDAMISFYTEVIGLKLLERSARRAELAGSLDEQSAALVLVQAPEPRYRHVCFEVDGGEETLVVSMEGLDRLGVPYAQLVERPGRVAVVVRDPDGLESEWYAASFSGSARHALPGGKGLPGVEGAGHAA